MDELGENSSNQINEYKLAKKLALIIATDFLCWVWKPYFLYYYSLPSLIRVLCCVVLLMQVPIIIIGFAALGGATIAPVVSAWIAVFILPLNSAVNPLLYTISTIDLKR